ncbi:hypothetical protein SAMN05421665_1580 [Yoonia rosea]|uniref:Lipoprotein n=1 Tax=Yoonia rosea TaxID=287098 RepID=A0A1R3WWT8_9RHOB|nr:hypothetical protein [Yoonia rosea]SIT83002.1 hypothetical protein SAMN05421665_1580 [Yoonia rosea]
MVFKAITKISVILLGFSLSACLPAETGQQNGASAEMASGTQAATRARASTSNPVVTASFAGARSSWNDGSTVIFRFTAIERDEEIFLCGAYTGSGSSFSSQMNRQLLRRSAATVNGETVMRNLSFFYGASADMEDSLLVGSETRCKSTGLAAGSVPLEAVKVELRQGRIAIRT